MLKLLIFLALTLAVDSAQAQATITITSPQDGDFIETAKVTYFYIEATHTGELIYPIVYEYTSNGGNSWLRIDSMVGTGTPDISNHRWKDVTDVDGILQIRIRDGNGVTGTSGAFRLISPARPIWLEINKSTYPLPKDADVLIEWGLNHDAEYIDLAYSQGIGAVRITQETLPGNARQFIWRTPPFDLPSVTLSLSVDNAQYMTVGPFAIGQPSAVKEVSETQVVLAPNPASSLVELRGLPAEVTTVQIIDLLGRIMASLPVNNSSIDVSTVPSGSYRIRSGSPMIDLPLVITR
jgi:hypothetical protein